MKPSIYLRIKRTLENTFGKFHLPEAEARPLYQALVNVRNALQRADVDPLFRGLLRHSGICDNASTQAGRANPTAFYMNAVEGSCQCLTGCWPGADDESSLFTIPSMDRGPRPRSAREAYEGDLWGKPGNITPYQQARRDCLDWMIRYLEKQLEVQGFPVSTKVA